MADRSIFTPDRRRFLQAGIAAAALASSGIPAMAQGNPMPADLRQELEQEQLGAVLGNASGDVTLTELFDYNCPIAASWLLTSTS